MKKLLLALPFSILLTACATEEVKPTSAPQLQPLWTLLKILLHLKQN